MDIFCRSWGESHKKDIPGTMLLAIVIIFVFLRLIVILFGSPSFFCESELYRGTVAQEIIHHKGWPLLAYQSEVHTGGSLVASLILIPFLLLFGYNLFAIKMAALIFSLATLFCVYYFIQHCLKSPPTAILTLLWFVFAPPLFLVYSTVLIGEHYCSQFFCFLALIFFYKMTSPQGTTNKNLFFSVLFGLTCGFSMYFSYTFSITLATCLAVWFLVDAHFFMRKTFFLSVLAAAIGFIPRFLYNLTFGFHALMIRENSLLEHINLNFNNVIERIFFLVTFYWPHGLWLGDLGNLTRPPLLGTMLGILFLVAFVTIVKKSWRAVAMNKEHGNNRALLLVLLYPPLFIVINAITDFGDNHLQIPSAQHVFIDDYTEFKYIFALFPFILIIISHFLINLVENKSRSLAIKFILPTAICLFFWSLSCFDIFKLTAIENFKGHLTRWQPYSYQLMGEHIIRFLPRGNLSQQIKYIDKVQMPGRKMVYFGFGTTFDKESFLRKSPAVMLPTIDPECRPYFVRGLGVAFSRELDEKTHPIRYSTFITQDIPEDLQPYFIEGIGLWAGVHQRENQFTFLPEKDLPAYFRGYAAGRLRQNRGNLENTLLGIRDVPKRYHLDFYTGLRNWAQYFMDFILDKPQLEQLISSTTSVDTHGLKPGELCPSGRLENRPPHPITTTSSE